MHSQERICHLNGPLSVKNLSKLLKTSLMTEPIFTYPDPNLPLCVILLMPANMLGHVF